MKTVYIPKGETVHYESLVTEHLVVHGHLHVTYGIKAKTVTGKGVINAGTIDADTVCIDDVEAASVICKRLLAKRVQSPEVFASESAAVSCFLSAAYVETGKLRGSYGAGLRQSHRHNRRQWPGQNQHRGRHRLCRYRAPFFRGARHRPVAQ